MKVANNQNIFHFICMSDTFENEIFDSRVNPGGTSMSEISSTMQYDAVLLYFPHVTTSQSNTNNPRGWKGYSSIKICGGTWSTRQNCGWGVSFDATTLCCGRYSSHYCNN